MTWPLAQERVNCPYCGERIDVLIDEQEAGHSYIEDCQICCKPIVFKLSATLEGELTVLVYDENDSF